ncbi:MAG: alpha-amylase [Ginsengibacter sp.]
MTQGVMIQYFHWYLPNDGSLWKQLKKDATYLKKLGFTTVWIPPAYKGASGGYSIGYDSYDLYDLGEFDQKGSTRTKYGTRDEYIAAVNAVRKLGMRAMVDIVINHKAGGDEIEKIEAVKVNPENRNEVISEPMEIEAFTKFTFPGRGKKYSKFEWNHTCFIGVDYAYNMDENSIFRILGDHEDSWQEMFGEEKGNFDYLMHNDIDFRNPYVAEEIHNWAKWYFDQANFDSVRLDAIKHINPQFYIKWLEKLRAATGKDIFAVGEYWEAVSKDSLVQYIEATGGTMSLFDSCLHHNIHNASKSGSNYDLRNILNNTLTEAIPQKSVTIIANHDTQPLQTLESTVDPWFKPIGYALILLRVDGYPCVFYPDLYGATYKDLGNDGNEYEIVMPKVEGIESLLEARKLHSFGQQRDYFDQPNCIGWTREGEGKKSGCAVLISNDTDNSKYMEMGKQYAGKIFKNLLVKRDKKVTINKEGWGEFTVPGRSVSVWVLAE